MKEGSRRRAGPFPFDIHTSIPFLPDQISHLIFFSGPSCTRNRATSHGLNSFRGICRGEHFREVQQHCASRIPSLLVEKEWGVEGLKSYDKAFAAVSTLFPLCCGSLASVISPPSAITGRRNFFVRFCRLPHPQEGGDPV